LPLIIEEAQFRLRTTYRLNIYSSPDGPATLSFEEGVPENLPPENPVPETLVPENPVSEKQDCAFIRLRSAQSRELSDGLGRCHGSECNGR
jgi:hypothetical protein